MSKKIFEEPFIEVVKLGLLDDVITASGNMQESGNDDSSGKYGDFF